MLKVSRFLVVLFPVLLTSCVSNSMQIGTNLTLCCPGNYSEYEEYGVTTRDIPLFLRDYLVAEFESAFSEKGLTRNDRANDIRVELSYNHVNLDSGQEDINPFVRIEAITEELSYIAQINIDIVETATGRSVWGGSVSRIHQVTPGEYMHEERARPAFRQAFLAVLTSYPSLISDDS